MKHNFLNRLLLAVLVITSLSFLSCNSLKPTANLLCPQVQTITQMLQVICTALQEPTLTYSERKTINADLIVITDQLKKIIVLNKLEK